MKTTITKIKSAKKCTVRTMSKGCFEQIDSYLRKFESVMGFTIQETKSNIMRLELFENGCFTYIQASAFAEYYHSI